MDPEKIVKLARKIDRPTALEFIAKLFDGFLEFHGDRQFRDDEAIVGGIALLDGKPITVVGIQKGHSFDENVKRNFGSPHPEGYRKALRLIQQAEKFKRPVVCLISTSGAYSGIGAEERGQGEAIAKNLYELSAVKTPIISVIIGEGGSGGALALAVADKVWMLENSIYSILSPEGFASILWKDSSRANEAAKLMKLTSQDLLTMEIIDEIIKESEDGISENFDFSVQILKARLIEEFNILSKIDVIDLVSNRYKRFRKFGDFLE